MLFKPFQPTITEPGLQRFGLSITHSRPCFALQGVVHSYLQISAEKPTPYPVIPDGMQALYISLTGSLIGGTQLTTRNIPLLEAGDYIGIRFYPGSLRHFFNVDLAQIENQLVDNSFFNCSLLASLHHQLYQQAGYHQRVELCENWLLKHFQPRLDNFFDHALSLIYRSNGNIKISEIANTVGRSSRQINRMFRLHIGVSTKSFSNIIRIQHASKQLYLRKTNSLTSDLDLGFFDQSHLIKDFKKYLAIKPSQVFDGFMSDFYNP